MRLRGVAIGLLAVCAAVVSASASGQTAGAGANSTSDAQHGKLTVWRVVAESPPGPAVIASLAPVVHSATAGSFGQTAGGFGQTAGSTGQTAGSFGGTVASQTAGSVGQTAGSFGESVGTLADAAAASNGTTALEAKHDAAWDRFAGDVSGTFTALDVIYRDVGADELQAQLEAVKPGQADAPDVLVGTPIPAAASGTARRFGLATLGAIGLVPQRETPEQRVPGLHPQAMVLARAPHPKPARAFVLWLLERPACSLCKGEDRGDPAATAVAKSALSSVLNGEGVGELADREMATFNPELAREAALGVSDAGVGNGVRIDINAVRATANARLAVVAMRAVLESRSAFGVVHAVAVLRADETGRWRVLQLTPNLLPPQQMLAFSSFATYCHPLDSKPAVVLGVALAAPVDGDNRPPTPELWWDNKGGATLEVVEWQRGSDRIWSGSNLFLIPDDTGHLQTQVTARFADAQGQYRWRVWSLGRGGAVAISPWRRFEIVPQ
jgi:hypothetical protein